jgi:hypothetical protein
MVVQRTERRKKMTYERTSRVFLSSKEYNTLKEAKDILRHLYAIGIIPRDDDDFLGEVYAAFDSLVILLDSKRLVENPNEPNANSN